MLSEWRVLDLTDHRGEVGPYLLADLGADVVRLDIDPAPRSGDDHDRFVAYNGNKSPLALTGDPERDRALVLDLVAGADLVFESGSPARTAQLGIDRPALTAANPGVVVVTVTPFGQTGPRADQSASELTIAALAGPVHLQGGRDRPPVQMSVPQVWRHTGAEAAAAALVAHRRMRTTGRPQFVDVSAQAVMTWTLLNAMETHAIQGRDFQRDGSILHLSLPIQLRLDTSDGYVVGVPTARSVRFLLPWLIEDGIVDDDWAETDWTTYDHRVISGEPVERPMAEVTEAVMELCRRHTTREVFLRGLALGATLAPMNTLADLLAFEHLDARSFWTDGPDDRSDGRRHPGSPIVIDGARPTVRRGAPPAPARAGDPWRSTTRRWSDAVGPEPAPADQLPLDGLKVVDFSWIGVGPITAKALADHGATVVRVESESRLDGLRLQVPYVDGVAGLNRSQFFASFNTSKLGLSLDLKNPAGLEVARQLTDWADVVVESFTPGTITRMGLGFDELAARNQRLIMVSTSLLGAGSEISTMAGYGYHAAAVAGFQNLVGWPDRPPDGPWLAYTDTIGPRFLTTTVLAALDQRERTGRGCHIEGAQLEIALQFLAPELATFQRTGELPPRRGNRAPDMAPQGVYPTAGDDRWLAITVTDDAAWGRLVDVLGRPGWATDGELATVAGRVAAHDRIDGELAAWTAQRDGATTEALLAEAGIAAGVVQASEHLLADPQYAHRGFYRQLDHAEVGTVPYAGHQYRIEGYDHGPRFAAPCLGEHTHEVLRDVLGLDDDAIAEIAASGALI